MSDGRVGGLQPAALRRYVSACCSILDRWPSGSRRAPGERANVTSNDDILSLKPHEMYEFPHNVFFAVVVEVAF